MQIKEYCGSLNIVDEDKLGNVKPKKDKLKEYEEALKNGKKLKKDDDKVEK